MKKTFFTLLVFFTAYGAFAQFEQGTMMVGGSLGIEATTNKSKANSTTVTNSKANSISLAPQFGYFVIDKLALGAGLNISTYTDKEEDSGDKFTATRLTIDPFVRYYLPVGVFFQGRFSIGTEKTKDKFGGTTVERTYNASGWGLSVGYAAFINDNVAIEPQIGYGSSGRKNTDTDVKNFDQGLFIRVGFQIYLRK